MTDNSNNLNEQWPRAAQYRKSIRLEFSLYISGVILALMAITGYIITDKYVDTVTQNVAEKLLIQARSYSGSAGKLIISTNGPDELLLNNLCKKLSGDNDEIHWSGIADRDNNFIAHTDIKKVVSSEKLTPIKKSMEYDFLQENEKVEIKSDTLFMVMPILENGITVGYLGAAASTDSIVSARNSTIYAVISITAIMLLIGIPITMIVLNSKLKPITVITESLQNMKFDDLSIDIPIKNRNEFGYLSETLNVMVDRLNSAQKDMIEKERITRELEIAREIQSNILPASFPSESSYEIAGSYRSALEVGGDYYDYFDFDEKYFAFLVADVSGKSLPGMLVMLMTRDLVRQYASRSVSPELLLTRTNEEIKKTIKKGTFITMFYGLLNKETGEITFASAGHNPLIYINGESGKIELIKTKGFPLGMMPTDKFEQRIELGKLTLRPGDWLIQYTDGINEAINSEGVEYGMDRFVDAVRSSLNGSADNLVDKVLKNHEEFVGENAQFDDITLLTVKWNGSNADNMINGSREIVNENIGIK